MCNVRQIKNSIFVLKILAYHQGRTRKFLGPRMSRGPYLPTPAIYATLKQQQQ